jgi:ketosteroid isomerase-like protein
MPSSLRAALSLVPLLLVLGSVHGRQAKDVRGEDPAHEELRALRAAIEKGVNEQDIDGLLEHVHKDVVVVWQNAEISRGHKGVRDYYQKYLAGPDALLHSYTIEPKVAELTILHGGSTGISYGTMTSHFKFKNGRAMDVEGPFSATLVKNDGKWQIAELHASVGLFSNPLVAAATSALWWGCGIAGAVGILVGALGMLLVRRRKAA